MKAWNSRCQPGTPAAAAFVLILSVLLLLPGTCAAQVVRWNVQAARSLASATVGNPQIGQISTQLGGAYSCSQYYRFYSSGGSNWTTTAATIPFTNPVTPRAPDDDPEDRE